MKLDPDLQVTIDNYLDTVQSGASLSYQKRIWIKHEGPEVEDFQEFLCFLGDFGLHLDEKQYKLSKHQLKLISEYSKMVRYFHLNYSSEEEFIETPEWANAIKKANEILNAFGVKERFN